MDSQQFLSKMRELTARDKKALDAIATYSRALVLVLKDHHADSSANEMERLLFELDVIREEQTKLVTDDPEGAFLAIIESFKPGAR